MKTILLTATILTLAFSGLAQTSPSTNKPVSVGSVVDTVKTTMSTNLNEVVIQMLSGFKDAGGEVYGASKVALAQSVDFVKEQAPDIIREFIAWNFFENLTFYLIWLIPSVVFIFMYRFAKRYAKDNKFED